MNSDDPIVFVVDDDSRVREALSSLIASVGIRVAAYGSAAEFLEAEKPDAPACLVLDLQTPGGERPRAAMRTGRRHWTANHLHYRSRRYSIFGPRHEGRRN